MCSRMSINTIIPKGIIIQSQSCKTCVNGFTIKLCFLEYYITYSILILLPTGKKVGCTHSKLYINFIHDYNNY